MTTIESKLNQQVDTGVEMESLKSNLYQKDDTEAEVNNLKGNNGSQSSESESHRKNRNEEILNNHGMTELLTDKFNNV